MAGPGALGRRRPVTDGVLLCGGTVRCYASDTARCCMGDTVSCSTGDTVRCYAGENRWSLMSRAAPITPALGPNSPRTMGRFPVANGSDWR